MRLFDKHFSFGLSLCGLFLLFLPKINLVSLGDRETAGIRIDDIFLVLICIVIGWAHFALKLRMNPIERWLAAVVAFSLFSFGMNRIFVAEGWLHVDANLFYCLRLAEYFVFFYLGAMCVQWINASTVIRAFFLWNLVLMLLQRFDLIGQFTSTGYTSSIGRVSGIASFPSEAGMLLVMIFCYLIYNDEKSRYLQKLVPPDLANFFSKTYIYWMFLICGALVIMTGSRIAIAALIIAFLFRVKDDLKKRSVATWLLATLFVSAGVVMTVFLIQNTDAVLKRSTDLISLKNFKLISIVWEQIDLSYDPVGNEAVKFESYDMSWWMRIHKWIYALKIYYLHPECWLQGVGPGFGMAALDGGFLRILTEYGIIGSFLFWKLFSAIYRQSIQLRWIIIGFAFNMIFFDVYLAYKPMSLLFFISGATLVSMTSTERQTSVQTYKKAVY